MCPPFWKSGLKVWDCWHPPPNRLCLSEKIAFIFHRAELTCEQTAKCLSALCTFSWSLIQTGSQPNAAFLSLWHCTQSNIRNLVRKVEIALEPCQCRRGTSMKVCLCRTSTSTQSWYWKNITLPAPLKFACPVCITVRSCNSRWEFQLVVLPITIWEWGVCSGNVEVKRVWVCQL